MRPVYLIGFSGTGKSTIAQLLAAELGVPHYDLDEMIVAEAGRPISAIFAEDGEPAFRQLETAQLVNLSARARTDGGVIATGGGVPVARANRQIMQAHGRVILLEAQPETIYQRLQAQQPTLGRAAGRPLLDAPDPLQRIRELQAARQAVYASAHQTIQTDTLTPQQIAAALRDALVYLEQQAQPPVPGSFRFGTRWFGYDRPLTCIPLVATTAAEAVALAHEAAAQEPDGLELRLDYLTDRSPAVVQQLLPQLAATGLPVLATNRLQAEGGVNAQEPAERIAVLQAALETGIPALVDCELATPPALREQLQAVAQQYQVPVLFSFHDFDRTPPDDALRATISAMVVAGAAAAKISVRTPTAADVARLLTLTRELTSGPAALPVPLAAMGIGPLGAITRVVGSAAGSALLFAALRGDAGSAPGQLTLAELRAIWAASATTP